MQLRLSTRTVEGVLVVDCSGRIVFGEESASLRDAVKKLLGESPKVVLNLRDVTYIDSGGLGKLVSLCTTVRHPRAALALHYCSQRRRRSEARQPHPAGGRSVASDEAGHDLRGI